MTSDKTESQKDKLNRLFKEHGLLKEDVHQHNHYTIIRRTGIEKIAAAAGIRLTYKLVKVQPDFAVIKATGKKGKGTTLVTIESYGSAGKDTSQNKYYVEMAEKRAKSRCVLQLSDLYMEGVYGEDEADDFSRAKNPEPKAEAQRPPVAAPAPEASAPATVAPAPSATPAPSGEPAVPAILNAQFNGKMEPVSQMVVRAPEADIEKLIQLIDNPLLDAEERSMLLSKPVDQRPKEWVENTLTKLSALLIERRDPKKALEAAQTQLRTAATKYATQLGEENYKQWMLRATSITAKPEELRAEARQILAYYQSAA